MTDRTELFTIGQLARRVGVSVRTVRFWSDLGLVPPIDRSTGGYRRYDVGSIARLDLLRTLRGLGLGLDSIRQILDRQVSLGDIALAHARALDAEIRTLRLRQAVLRSVARRGSTTEELKLMHDLAHLSALERQQIIDDFVAETFAGIAPDAPGAGLAQAMRGLPAELPDDPTDEEVDAWVELAELVADSDFRQRVRQMAVAGSTGAGQPAYDLTPGLVHARAALAGGVAPESAEGQAVLARIVGPEFSGDELARLTDQLTTFTDRRVERYWQLIGVLNRQPSFPPSVPVMEWLIAALRAAH